MFDLFRSRDKAVRYVLGGLLMLVALSMVITLIPGWGSQTGSDDQVVAEIGKTAITVRQVQTELQSLVRNRQVPAEMLQVYAPQYIDQMIIERAVSYQAARMGFRVTDSELANTIRAMIPRLFNNGQLVDKAAYENLLAERGMSIPEFESMVREQILRSRLQNLASEGVVITPKEIQAQYEKTHEKAKIEYIAFKSENLKRDVKVTPEDLKAYYAANQNTYMEGEKRDLALLVADQEKIGATINISDAQLRQAYDSQRNQFRTPERVKVRHILVKTTDKPPAEVAKLKEKAQDLLKQIKGGGNFAELAKKNSDDTASAEKGGELGWVTRGQTVQNFENAAFSLKPGQTSDVISTEYGFHILQVEEKQDAHTQTFDEVKDQIAAEMKKQLLFERMQTAADQARAALDKNPSNIDQIANQYALEVVRVDKASAGQSYPQAGAVPDMDAAMAGLKKGEVTPVFQAPGDKLVFAEVLNTYPAHVQPLTDVEARVREAVVNQKAQVLATDRANQAASKLNAGEDINKVAKELGAEVKTSTEFTINDAIEGVGSATMFSQAFSKPVGAILGPVPSASGASIVAKVIAKVPADMSQLEASRQSIITDLKQKKAQEQRELFYDSILAQLIKEGKVKKHNDTIRRLVASYRA
jgi:peptidyl-prolyl cis-trans isomerase D